MSSNAIKKFSIPREEVVVMIRVLIIYSGEYCGCQTKRLALNVFRYTELTWYKLSHRSDYRTPVEGTMHSLHNKVDQVGHTTLA
ncbi:hypothetical protein BDY19DRAFT_976995 [Irpex rosettiformis]|uniref:Uncharacterized protein n=1 Tax=Irpex rosettiformis TaxID=378272 RepID=A0ACB8TNM1_9APHY|nr:hypothetical protein BDY19DRAFT_976995 [Irpex rosettiformis]